MRSDSSKCSVPSPFEQRFLLAFEGLFESGTEGMLPVYRPSSYQSRHSFFEGELQNSQQDLGSQPVKSDKSWHGEDAFVVMGQFTTSKNKAPRWLLRLIFQIYADR